MNTKRFKFAEIIGIFLIFAGAVFLHFYYELSGGSVLSVLIGAVNESVWENLKIFIAPYFIWSALELFWVQPPFRRFTVGKAVGIYFFLLANIAEFYAYTFFTHRPILALDIGFSLLWLILSTVISYKITLNGTSLEDFFPAACALLFLLAAMYFSFSVFPPHFDLFFDRTAEIYGFAQGGVGV